MDIEQARELKARAAERLGELIAENGTRERLRGIDGRLWEYVSSIAEDPEWHNMWEVLAAVKWLRMLGEYYFDAELARRVFQIIEGRWEQGAYVPESGGFELDSIRGRRHYPMLPLQCFMMAGIYCFKYYADLGPWDGRMELLPSECLNPENGHVLDLRRVVTDVTAFWPRKTNKSGLAADCAMIEMCLADKDSETYICTNAESQSLLLLEKVEKRLRQLDKRGRLFRFTQKEITWRKGQARSSVVVALSAGGKTKDGLKASLCLRDEYGSAVYTKRGSDMASLVQVVESSMGPRRQPLSITTTTAGNAIEGPFQLYLEGVKEILRKEIEADGSGMESPRTAKQSRPEGESEAATGS